ncbi:MAG: SdpI family protein [Bacteroidota bacterium]
MKNKFVASDWIVLSLVIIPLIYLTVIYSGLPAIVPTHFNLKGEADDTSVKSALWLATGLIGILSILLYLLLKFLPSIDPKKQVKYGAASFKKIAIGVVFLLFLINCMIIRSAETGSFESGNALPIAMGLFFAFMGNVMYSIKPNYFAGIRTPWTLESDDTWRETHRLAGKLWFAGGIIIALCGLIFSFSIAIIILIAVTIIITVWPVVFSYTYFKGHQNKKD